MFLLDEWFGNIDRSVFFSLKGDIQDLPSKPKAQMASGQGSHWLIESPSVFVYV